MIRRLLCWLWGHDVHYRVENHHLASYCQRCGKGGVRLRP